MQEQERPGCLGMLLQALGLQPKPAAVPAVDESTLPYRLVEKFASLAELSFYHVLSQVVGGQMAVFSKVSLGDLFYPKTGDRGQNAAYRNKINRKHVDFLLCDPRTLHPLAGIELDDVSHQREDRVARDRFVDRVFAAAGLPLVRFPVQAEYSLHAIAMRLRDAGLPVGKTAVESVSPAPATEEVVPPLCPKCGIPMILRTVTRDGPHKGKQFYGCANYPQCREMAPVM